MRPFCTLFAAQAGHGQIVAYLKHVVTTTQNDVSRIVAVWECFFENAGRRAMGASPRPETRLIEPVRRRPGRSGATATAPPGDRASSAARVPPARGPGRTTWHKEWSADHERFYYVADDASLSTWTAPRAPGDVVVEAAPSSAGGWCRRWDEASGYYYSDAAGAASWVPPDDVAAALRSAEYTECYDVQSGRNYRYSERTGETTWHETDDPPKWCRVVDARGSVYFCDETSGDAVWEPPPDAHHARTSEWALVDADNRPYWLHEPSGTTRWKRPVVRSWMADDEYFTDLATGDTAWDCDPDDLLDADWSMCWDTHDGPPFYYNAKTNESKWTPPWAEVTPPIAAPTRRLLRL